MKKKYCSLSILGVLVSTSVLFGQVSRYEFSQQIGSYVPLQGAEVIATANSQTSLNRGIFTKNLPFTFHFNGQPYNEVHIFTDGFVTFGEHVPAVNDYNFKPLFANSSVDAHKGVIAVASEDLTGLFLNGKTGQILTKESGVSPNRVFTIEWKHFTRRQSEGYSDYYYDMHFQIKLHENGVIEKVYNMSAVDSPDGNYYGVGLRGSSPADFATRKANGNYNNNWNSTQVGTNATDQVYASDVSLPRSGLTFIWTPPADCRPLFQYGADGNMITHVGFNTIANTSPFVSGTPTYEDFTSISTSVARGTTHSISVKGPSSTFPSDVMVYIDFNKNGDFSDVGEGFYVGRLQPANPANAYTITADITIPTTAIIGETKMRLVKNTNIQALTNPNASNSISGPCDGNLRSGQVEEYTINITNNLAINEVQSRNNLVEIYPNPVSEVVYFKAETATIKKVEIYDTNGKLVFIGKEESAQVGHLSKGMYFVKIQQTDGKVSNTKFVKK